MTIFHFNILPTGQTDNVGYLSDGDRCDFNSLIIQLFELLTVGLSCRSLESKVFLGPHIYFFSAVACL